VFAGVHGVVCVDVNRPMISAPFTKKRTHNLGQIYFQKNDLLEDVGGKEVGGKCGASKGVVCVGGRVFVGACCR